MKKTIIMAVAAFAAISCAKDPGSISGNVFYKYNDYVGNKPDAGTTIKLYDADAAATAAKYETTSDVQGNYKIDGVEPDEYIAFIQSKSTTAKDTDILSQLQTNSKELKQVFGVDVDKMDKDIKELKSLDDKAAETYASAMANLGPEGDKYVTEYGKILKDRAEKSKQIFGQLPADFSKMLGMTDGYGPKIELKKISVTEAQNFQNVTDFGITYK